MHINVKFSLGDIVFLKVNERRWPGMITALFVRPDGVMYQVTWTGGEVSAHFDIELTDEGPDPDDDNEEDDADSWKRAA